MIFFSSRKLFSNINKILIVYETFLNILSLIRLRKKFYYMEKIRKVGKDTNFQRELLVIAYLIFI
jgi:hypothetical protein